MKNKWRISLGIIFLPLFAFTGHHPAAKTKHVILIGVDGLGAYAFPKATAPAIKKMMANGAWSLHARSVLPSSSACNWASILMGAGTELHGYTEWDSRKPELPSKDTTEYGMFPTIFYLAKTQQPRLKTAVLYTWAGIGYLFEKDCVGYSKNIPDDSLAAIAAAAYIKKEKPNLLFVHFSDVDGVGHNTGHDTPAYYAQITKTDALINQLLEAIVAAGIADETVVLLTADHGGINKGHGGKTLREVEIPWIAYGGAIKQKGEIKESIVAYDTGATIAWLLGLAQPQVWTGRPLKTIF